MGDYDVGCLQRLDWILEGARKREEFGYISVDFEQIKEAATAIRELEAQYSAAMGALRRIEQCFLEALGKGEPASGELIARMVGFASAALQAERGGE